jgi:hypothetical protein
MRLVERRRIAHASDRLERHRVVRKQRHIPAGRGRSPRPKISARNGEYQSGMSRRVSAAIANDVVWRSMNRCSRRRQRVQSAIAWSSRWGMRTSRRASCQKPPGPEHCPTGACTPLNCQMICGCAAVGGIACSGLMRAERGCLPMRVDTFPLYAFSWGHLTRSNWHPRRSLHRRPASVGSDANQGQ